MRSVALPHRRCSLTTSCASSQSPPSPWPGFYKMDNSQYSSSYSRFSSAVILHPDEQECREEIFLHAPAASWTFAWLFTRLPDENSSGHGRDSSAELLHMDETEGDVITCRPFSLAMLLVYMSASLQSPPSHWPSPPYGNFISSGLRFLYRCPLRGLPIPPTRRWNGSCKWVRS